MAFIKDSQEALIPDPVYEEIRSAINIKKALDSIRGLRQLGYCPTKVQKFRKQFGLDDEDDSYDGNSNQNPEGRFRTRDLANQVCKYHDSGLWNYILLTVFFRLG
jgi:hypothetical protein